MDNLRSDRLDIVVAEVGEQDEKDPGRKVFSLKLPLVVRFVILVVTFVFCALVLVYVDGVISQAMWNVLAFLLALGNLIGAYYLCGSRFFTKRATSVPWKSNLYYIGGVVLLIVYLGFLAFIGAWGIFFYHHLVARDVVCTYSFLRVGLPKNDHMMTFYGDGERLYFDTEKNTLQKEIRNDDGTLGENTADTPWKYRDLTNSASGKYSFQWNNLTQELYIVANSTGEVMDRIRGGAVKFAWWDARRERVYFLITAGWDISLICMREYLPK